MRTGSTAYTHQSTCGSEHGLGASAPAPPILAERGVSMARTFVDALIAFAIVELVIRIIERRR